MPRTYGPTKYIIHRATEDGDLDELCQVHMGAGDPVVVDIDLPFGPDLTLRAFVCVDQKREQVTIAVLDLEASSCLEDAIGDEADGVPPAAVCMSYKRTECVLPITVEDAIARMDDPHLREGD